MLSQSLHKETQPAITFKSFQAQKLSKHAVAIKQIKRLSWIYFYLIIFEGALRKWFLPQLATPLLVVRDPIAVWALLVAWNNGLLKANGYLISIIAIGIISFVTAITLGHGNVLVALFGARIYLIHFSFMFVMASVLDEKDVIQYGKVTLLISIFMTVLIAVQFYSPQSDWVNRGVGGDETGAGFAGALGYARPPGTFSFTSGNTTFYSYVAAYVFYFWLNSNKINKLLLIASTGALMAAIPLSISRGLFFSVIISAFFALVASTTKPSLFKNIIGAIAGILLVLLILSQTEFFQTATEAFSRRLEGANDSEGGYQGVLVDRYLGGLAGAIINSYQYPFFGYGMGMGTNVGGMLLTGKASRALAEGDWGRIIGEQGLLLGLLVILIRLIFSADLTVRGYKLIKYGNVLPWMLLSFGLLAIPQSQWGQPTTLGFSTLIGGLLLSSFKNSES